MKNTVNGLLHLTLSLKKCTLAKSLRRSNVPKYNLNGITAKRLEAIPDPIHENTIHPGVAT